MKKLLFNSVTVALFFVACNSSSQHQDKLDSIDVTVDTLQSATSADSTTVTDSTVIMKDEENEITSGVKKENHEMPEHHAPNQSKVDSIKNSYHKKK